MALLSLARVVGNMATRFDKWGSTIGEKKRSLMVDDTFTRFGKFLEIRRMNYEVIFFYGFRLKESKIICALTLLSFKFRSRML